MTPPRSRGFSLVELMVAMTLGLVLISGMVAVFSGNKRSGELNTAMANLQENARFALDRIAVDIRSAGFQGCLDIGRGPADIHALVSPTNDLQRSAASAYVVSSGNAWSPSAPPGFSTILHDVKPGTHVLSLMFGGQDTFPITQMLQDASGTASQAGNIRVSLQNDSNTKSLADLNLQAGDLALITDCGAADLFAISSVTTGVTNYSIGHSVTHNSTPLFNKVYGLAGLDDVRFMVFTANIYYVGDTGQTNETGDAIFSLYRQSFPYNDLINNPPIELVQGVENMRISFGVNTGGNNLTYRDPDDALLDNADIESVRIGLLMSSENEIAQIEDNATYMLAGQPITAAAANATTIGDNEHARDGRFRLAFNTTVKIRNRRR